jgi:DNA-binding NarL/FixJ family response regulator
MTAITILIVDDHPLFADGFTHMARILRPDWTLLCAISAADALRALEHARPDLAIVDVGLPDRDGFELLAAMAVAAPRLPVILLSGRDDAAVRVRARASGAAGFIAKAATPDFIVGQIDSVLAGGTGFADPVCGGDIPVLTQRQAEVLTLLAEGHGNKEIRHRLGIAERTVRAHLTELFQALGASSRMQAVIRGRALGLIER